MYHLVPSFPKVLPSSHMPARSCSVIRTLQTRFSSSEGLFLSPRLAANSNRIQSSFQRNLVNIQHRFITSTTVLRSEKPTTNPQDNTNPTNASPVGDMASSNEDAYTRAFNNNSTWRRSLAEQEPELFEKLGKGQAPQILWIGCADSRCPETTILGLQPGEIFCHRNIANILTPTDLNSLSVIQFAVQYLKVKHIIICGHTSCGGIAAALDNKKLGLIDTWLMPLRTLRRENLTLLESLDTKERGLKLVELNVRSGVKVLLENPTVIDAMAERGLAVHGLIYNVGTGELREIDTEEDDEIVGSRKTAFKTN